MNQYIYYDDVSCYVLYDTICKVVIDIVRLSKNELLVEGIYPGEGVYFLRISQNEYMKLRRKFSKVTDMSLIDINSLNIYYILDEGGELAPPGFLNDRYGICQKDKEMLVR